MLSLEKQVDEARLWFWNCLIIELTIWKSTMTIPAVIQLLNLQEERERHRLKEKERALRIEERRRQIERERQREIERRQREEAVRLERYARKGLRVSSWYRWVLIVDMMQGTR